MCNTQLSDPYLPLFTVNQHAIGSWHAELHVNKAIQMFMCLEKQQRCIACQDKHLWKPSSYKLFCLIFPPCFSFSTLGKAS